MNDFNEDLKKVILAGIGAVALTAEKSKDMIEEFVKKGELTIEEGKVLNEELKYNIVQKLKDPVTVKSVSHDLEKLSIEDLDVLKAKIEELKNGKSESE